MKIRERILKLSGAISTSIGAMGIAIAEFGLCACVWAPVFSFIGIISIISGFLVDNKALFFSIGLFLIFISFFFHKKKKVCVRHKKK